MGREVGGEVTWKWRSGGGVGRVAGRVDGGFGGEEVSEAQAGMQRCRYGARVFMRLAGRS
jgi:hypothetical protein